MCFTHQLFLIRNTEWREQKERVFNRITAQTIKRVQIIICSTCVIFSEKPNVMSF